MTSLKLSPGPRSALSFASASGGNQISRSPFSLLAFSNAARLIAREPTRRWARAAPRRDCLPTWSLTNAAAGGGGGKPGARLGLSARCEACSVGATQHRPAVFANGWCAWMARNRKGRHRANFGLDGTGTHDRQPLKNERPRPTPGEDSGRGRAPGEVCRGAPFPYALNMPRV